MYRSIRDYAVIGNLRSAALVSKDGSIDWAPAPFIDSPSVFAAILDDNKGGSWSVAPAGKFFSYQRYLPNTNVLSTNFKTQDGECEVVDFIPIEKERTFLPAEEDTTFRLHRKLSCVKGVCVFRTVFNPKLDYAMEPTTLEVISEGVRVRDSRGNVRAVLDASGDFSVTDEGAVAELILREGEADFQIFRYNMREIARREDAPQHHEGELQDTIKFWRRWAHKCDLKTCPTSGPWHGLVVRSALLLKILFFEPVGTIAAAPTTSLPETIGGVRNWDYRFSWIRDSAFTLRAFFVMGHVDEAKEYFHWLISECREALLNTETLQIMYGLQGEKELEEELLTHLDGYMGSKPVRIGNAAYVQRQLDIYGSILDTAWQLHVFEKTKILNAETWNALRSVANYAVRIWREPDEGLWEVRGGRSHFVYSKMMCWVALDRAIKLALAYRFEGEFDLWREEKDEIYREIMKRGWSDKKKSFVQSFDSENLDASVLLMPVVGFIDGRDPKMISTIDAIRKELSAGEGLIYRYASEDGLPGEEGAFLPASFWLTDALVLAGRRREAREFFEKVVSFANHVGLFSEEADPRSKELLGNFPQALTHIGLINSAFTLESGIGEA